MTPYNLENIVFIVRGVKNDIQNFLDFWISGFCVFAYNIRKTLSLLFVLFLLAASRKSTDSGKYHLLEKRNPFYFLAYFFYFLATFFTFQLTFT